eukprot:gb/GFBE01049646.1/.p1 GENE.gb/GFBE01049646.1/~~gb/GFBE01049646.1/.p1  ORF type:complete len:1103 (+),score=161.70 gb/GFBE01049646.1/:1-3309(+)
MRGVFVLVWCGVLHLCFGQVSQDVAYLGWAEWKQATCGGAQTQADQESLMDSACAAKFPGTQAATISQLVEGLIDGLPADTLSSYYTIIKCGSATPSQCYGTGVATSRQCISSGFPWPTDYAPNDAAWYPNCCTGNRATLCAAPCSAFSSAAACPGVCTWTGSACSIWQSTTSTTYTSTTRTTISSTTRTTISSSTFSITTLSTTSATRTTRTIGSTSTTVVVTSTTIVTSTTRSTTSVTAIQECMSFQSLTTCPTGCFWTGSSCTGTSNTAAINGSLISTGSDDLLSVPSSKSYYRKYQGQTCTGASDDLLRDFPGTEGDCLKRAAQLKASGFVRVSAGSQFAGKCYFLSGKVSQPAAYNQDDRDCYRLEEGSARYVERSLVADEGNEVGVLFNEDPEICKELCDSTARCNSFSFYEVDGLCSLRDKVVTSDSPASSNASKLLTWRTFYRMCPAGYNYSHTGYWDNAWSVQAPFGRVISSTGTSASQCAEWCDSSDSCVAFNLANGSNCWVYDSVGSQVEDLANLACIKQLVEATTTAASPDDGTSGFFAGVLAWFARLELEALILMIVIVSLGICMQCVLCVYLCRWSCRRKRKQEQFSMLPGSEIPDFKCVTSQGNFYFHSFLKKQQRDGMTLLLTYRKDFLPICATEIGTCHVLQQEFQKRGVQIIGLGCGGVEMQDAWIKDVLVAKQASPNQPLGFPLIADEHGRIARKLGLLDVLEQIHGGQGQLLARAMALIGPDKRVLLSAAYPAETGRNFLEVLRLIDSLFVTRLCCVATPAEWHPGDYVVPKVHLSCSEAPEVPYKAFGALQQHGWWDVQLLRHRVEPGGDVPAKTELSWIKLGCVFPDFATGQTSFHQHLESNGGQWTILFCWPSVLSPVTASELMACHRLLGDFTQRGVRLVGLSNNTLETHQKWTTYAMACLGKDNFELGLSLLSDSQQQVVDDMGLKAPQCVRGLFVIDSDKRVRLSMFHPETTGFNISEVLRVIDSEILTQEGDLSSPADWQRGDAMIVNPNVPAHEARVRHDGFRLQALPSGKEYLRYVSCPNPAHADATLAGAELNHRSIEILDTAFERNDVEVEPPVTGVFQSLLGKSENFWLF